MRNCWCDQRVKNGRYKQRSSAEVRVQHPNLTCERALGRSGWSEDESGEEVLALYGARRIGVNILSSDEIQGS